MRRYGIKPPSEQQADHDDTVSVVLPASSTITPGVTNTKTIVRPDGSLPATGRRYGYAALTAAAVYAKNQIGVQMRRAVVVVAEVVEEAEAVHICEWQDWQAGVLIDAPIWVYGRRRQFIIHQNGGVAWAYDDNSNSQFVYGKLDAGSETPDMTNLAYPFAFSDAVVCAIEWNGVDEPVLGLTCFGVASIEGPYTWDETGGFIKRYTQSGSNLRMYTNHFGVLSVSSTGEIGYTYKHYDDTLPLSDSERIAFSKHTAPGTRRLIPNTPFDNFGWPVATAHKPGDDTTMIALIGKDYINEFSTPDDSRVMIKRSTNSGISWTGTGYLPAPYQVDEIDPEDMNEENARNSMAWGDGVVVVTYGIYGNAYYNEIMPWAYSTDDGANWTVVETELTNTLTIAAFADGYWRVTTSPDGRRFLFTQLGITETGQTEQYMLMFTWDPETEEFTKELETNWWEGFPDESADPVDIVRVDAAVADDASIHLALIMPDDKIYRRDCV